MMLTPYSPTPCSGCCDGKSWYRIIYRDVVSEHAVVWGIQELVQPGVEIFEHLFTGVENELKLEEVELITAL